MSLRDEIAAAVTEAVGYSWWPSEAFSPSYLDDETAGKCAAAVLAVLREKGIAVRWNATWEEWRADALDVPEPFDGWPDGTAGRVLIDLGEA